VATAACRRLVPHELEQLRLLHSKIGSFGVLCLSLFLPLYILPSPYKATYARTAAVSVIVLRGRHCQPVYHNFMYLSVDSGDTDSAVVSAPDSLRPNDEDADGRNIIDSFDGECHLTLNVRGGFDENGAIGNTTHHNYVLVLSMCGHR
jgi:hypothetical protein